MHIRARVTGLKRRISMQKCLKCTIATCNASTMCMFTRVTVMKRAIDEGVGIDTCYTLESCYEKHKTVRCD